MTIMFMLIGLPGVGKSTWIKDPSREGIPVVSTDAYIEDFARLSGQTYNDVFSDQIKAATSAMDLNVDLYIKNDRAFIWDQTNLTIKSRKQKLNKIPDHWNKIAVYFEKPEDIEWKRRLNSRPGKVIPDFVLNNMQKNFEYPTIDEGFSSISVVPA